MYSSVNSSCEDRLETECIILFFVQFLLSSTRFQTLNVESEMNLCTVQIKQYKRSLEVHKLM